jgi:murein DD-endopeptidase MepM/ murein hydrolase activator NlpD
MADYTPGQRRIIARIKAVGRQVGASPKEIKAALETGRVEANFSNPGHATDHDSLGWRQERASLYPNPTNLDASIRRFFQETKAVRGKYGTSGALAAAVQRPAAQYRGRYAQVSSEAQRLLEGRVGGSVVQTGRRRAGGSSGRGSPGSPGRAERIRTITENTPGVDNRVARAALIQSFLEDHNSDPVDFAVQANALKDIAPTSTSRTIRTPGIPARAASRSSSGRSSRVSRGVSVHSPVGRQAKVIGTPHTGTHTLGNWQSDNAVDIAVPIGTPMVALQDGVVVKVRHHPQGAGRFAGDQITVRGANGNEYFYAHGVARVKPGQRVRRGQKLGTTGSANGVAHLHFGQERGDPREHT